MKKLLIFVTFCFFNFSIICQTPSLVKHIRFPVWAEVDAFPGWSNEESSEWEDFEYPISRIKETTPFLINGMIYGWDFVYVPSDKTRGVEEFFELKEINPGEDIASQIQYSSTWIEDNKFNCWVDFERTEMQVRNYNLWSSIKNPVIKGIGYGSLSDGFEGIKKASVEAVKNAVREHFRTKYKNKPKEITGSVLIRKSPLMGIDQGRYVVHLDFFLEYGKIKQYTQF